MCFILTQIQTERREIEVEAKEATSSNQKKKQGSSAQKQSFELLFDRPVGSSCSKSYQIHSNISEATTPHSIPD